MGAPGGSVRLWRARGETRRCQELVWSHTLGFLLWPTQSSTHLAMAAWACESDLDEGFESEVEESIAAEGFDEEADEGFEREVVEAMDLAYRRGMAKGVLCRI